MPFLFSIINKPSNGLLIMESIPLKSQPVESRPERKNINTKATKEHYGNLRECLISRVRLGNDQIRPNLPDRLDVYRMVADFRILSAQQNGTPAQMGTLANHQCDLICEPNRLPIAYVAHGSSAVAGGVWILLALELIRVVGTAQCNSG